MADENTTTTNESSSQSASSESTSAANDSTSNDSGSDSSTTKAADLKKGDSSTESSGSEDDKSAEEMVKYFVKTASSQIVQASGGNSIIGAIVTLLTDLLLGNGLGSLTGGNGVGNTNADSITGGANDDNPFKTRNDAPSNWSYINQSPVPEYHNVYKVKYIEPTFKPIPETDEYKKTIYNEDTTKIQNKYKFPKESSADSTATNSINDKTKKYDYQILVGDSDLELSKSLEDKLQEVRAQFGITVHGSNRTARSMKYYMYNRYKVPDTNLAHNKTFTHVFFTRPDLNVLDVASKTANSQIMSHSDASLYWRKYPDLFKLLTDGSRCGDNNNLNLLLSNQIQSFEPKEHELQTDSVGKNWNDYSITYGNAYTNKTGNEFSCEFVDTANLEVMHLLKIWMLYIDNVSRGAWKPSYDLRTGTCGSVSNSMEQSYVYQKTLDYAAAAYMFKTGPDGEDIIYWTKYYGVFPLNDGSSVLNYQNGSDSISKAPVLNIKFAYSFKRDMSPISIVEFNNNCGVAGDPIASNQKFDSFSEDKAGMSTRPFVSRPYIDVVLGNPQLKPNDIASGEETHLRLKYVKETNAARDDKILFRPTLAGSSSGKANSPISNIAGDNPLSTVGNAVASGAGFMF